MPLTLFSSSALFSHSSTKIKVIKINLGKVSLGGRMDELIYGSTQATIFDVLMKTKDLLK